jgi:hypothetical protein
MLQNFRGLFFVRFLIIPCAPREDAPYPFSFF